VRKPQTSITAVLAALAFAAAAFTAAPALAQKTLFGDKPPARIYQNQPPITSNDCTLGVLLYVYFIQQNGDDRGATEIATSLGYTQERAAFIYSRYNIGLNSFIADFESESYEETAGEVASFYGTPLAVPSQAELELIEKSMGAFMKLLPNAG
jgi:hypothetical protein